MRKIGKKADYTVNEFLSIVLAILAMFLISYALFKLYSIYFEQEEKNAKKNLEKIESVLNEMSGDYKGEIVISGFKGSENWYLVGWSLNLAQRPEKCALSSCLCICRGGPSAEYCQKDGFCKMIALEKIYVETKEVFSEALPLVLGQEENGIQTAIHAVDASLRGGSYFSEFSCDMINLKNNLISVKVEKNKDRAIVKLEESINFEKNIIWTRQEIDQIDSKISCLKIRSS